MPYRFTSTMLPLDFAVTISGAVAQLDFELKTCMDGDTASERLKSIMPDIVMFPLNLPGTPGEDIPTPIRADAKSTGTRVITGATDECQMEALTDKTDILLPELVSSAQLLERIPRIGAR